LRWDSQGAPTLALPGSREGEFAAASTQGQAMSVEQLIAEALLEAPAG
jgi:hypothetical protein